LSDENEEEDKGDMEDEYNEGERKVVEEGDEEECEEEEDEDEGEDDKRSP